MSSVMPESARIARILVVDDTAMNLQIVATVLSRAGYQVFPATSGAEALKRVETACPELILLDVNMPEMDGFEVLRRLRHNPHTRDTPVIFVTAANDVQTVTAGLEAGAVDYVSKPFNPAELLARIRTHIELKRSRDELIRCAQELAVSNEQLIALNNEKNEFLGVAAHDLRNPLSGILGMAEMLIESPELPHADAVRMLEMVAKSAQEMFYLIQALLDVNAIEEGKMAIQNEAFSAGSLLRDLQERHSTAARQKHIQLHLALPAQEITLFADRLLTAQVLTNLLSNAIKYSPFHKEIWITLFAPDALPNPPEPPPTSPWGSIAIRDQGPGLTAADKAKLFGKFVRLSAQPTGGELSVGLGLSIVKKLLIAMHGAVWCDSEPDQGATFYIALPMHTA